MAVESTGISFWTSLDIEKKKKTGQTISLCLYYVYLIVCLFFKLDWIFNHVEHFYGRPSHMVLSQCYYSHHIMGGEKSEALAATSL